MEAINLRSAKVRDTGGKSNSARGKQCWQAAEQFGNEQPFPAGIIVSRNVRYVRTAETFQRQHCFTPSYQHYNAR
jgi:hypothetical protein